MISDPAMVRAINSRPQRLAAAHPPGSLLKRNSDHPRRSVNEATGRDGAYLAMIRQLPCVKCGVEPCGTAAHLRMNSGAYNKRQAMGRKPSAEWTTPLCNGCHTNDYDAQHKVGEREFWHRLGINPFLLCQRLHAQRGDLVAMRAVVMVAIAERSISASSPSSSVAYHAEASPAFPPHQAPPPRPERKPEGDGDEGATAEREIK